MTSAKLVTSSKNLSEIITMSLGLPWFEIAGELWKIGRKLMRGLSNEGMYEVLEYESTLELHDRRGKKATFTKRMKVRYLQDNIIAFQDFAWGDGDILLNYRTSRGKAVDRYKSGYKTYILLSLQEVKNRGDVDEFNISWDIREGFLKSDGYWATDIRHRMKQTKVNIIFPRSRPAQQLLLEETNRRRTRVLGREFQKRLADGRWQITWEMKNPKLYELYTIRWDW